MSTTAHPVHHHEAPPAPTGFRRLTAGGWLRVLWTTPLFFGIGAGLVVLIRWAAHWHPLWKATPLVSVELVTPRTTPATGRSRGATTSASTPTTR
jgi:hypothetical protein